jgi:hypothetical protein
MNAFIAWGATVLDVALLIGFACSLLSLRRVPTKERPRTPTYDRFGHPVALAENPDYHENPGEQNAEAIKLPPSPPA